MDYAVKHQEALRKVKDKGGVAVTFQEVITGGGYDPLTDTYAPRIIVTTEGYGVEIPGEPEELAALELISRTPVVIFFVPLIYDDIPSTLATLDWAGAIRTIEKIIPIRPAGKIVAARVILG